MPRRRKTAENQLELAFPTGAEGESPRSPTEGHGAPSTVGPTESQASAHLMEEVCQRENLNEAYRRVMSNKGAPGVDGMPVSRLGKHLRKHWSKIREQLLQGTYRPKPVKRVEIPKPDGGVRKLGIPTVLDRMIQQALLQVLQLQWDPTFSPHSYGFRPGRSQKGAIAEAQTFISDGYRVVVDLDLEKFFDRVNHDILMSLVAKRVSDKRVLRLIRGFLTAGIMDDGVTTPSEEGTPQGGPLSPLLSNLMLDVLDKELEQRKLRFVRYADDCNIYVRSERAGLRIMEGVKAFLGKRLKLKVNESKSKVDKPANRKFLGFSFTGTEYPKIRIAPQSIEKFREKIRELTKDSTGRSLSKRIEDLGSYVRGWIAYFGICETPSVLKNLDAWIRRRIRCLIWRQWKTGKKRFQQLVARGLDRQTASKLAGSHKGPWHTSHSKPLDTALSNAYLSSLGLPSLVNAHA